MKKLLILSLSLFFSLTTVGHAVQYPLEVAVTDTDMTVTLSGATGQTTPLLILAQTAPFQGNAVDYAQNNGIVRFLDEGIGRPSPFDRTRQPNSSGVAVWKFSTLPNTTYYIRIYNVTNIANPQLVTETKTVTTPKVTSFYGASLAITTNGQQASFTGKVDTSRYGTVAPMRITLEYALDKDFAQKQIAQSTKTKGGAIEGVSDDGTYYFELSGLTPKQLYFFRQIVQIGGTTITVPGDSFRAGETYVPSGSVEATINDNVYNLLAPWPNFTKLMDPGMCAQQKAQGTLPANAVCDVNGFINFAFKTLIGLTAVMLVLRLVYEGYKYVVTDVPFLKANAKSEFGTALVGLLIALSAYTIFNTINPKLVSNTISIDQVAVGVDEVWDRADDQDFMTRLDSVSIDGVAADLQDETFLAYLAHQQGAGGASMIIEAARTGKNVPEKIYKNMSSNFNKQDAQRTIGTPNLTPTNFLKYWAIKVGAFKKNPKGNIPDFINNQLVRVSQETRVPLATLQVMCRIESGCNSIESIKVVNKYGYAGLFQLSNQEHRSKVSGRFSGKIWESYKKPDGILLDAYHNAYAGAGYLKSNLAYLKK